MKEKLKEEQVSRIKGYYADNVYFKVCLETFFVFRSQYPTLFITAADLFVEAATFLDRMLATGDADLCRELWSHVYRDYRDLEGSSVSEDDTMAETAMTAYAVMYGLGSVDFAYYRVTMLRMLHVSIASVWGVDRCKAVERSLAPVINTYTQDMIDWMATYFVSRDLSVEIGSVILGRDYVAAVRLQPEDEELISSLLPIFYQRRDEVEGYISRMRLLSKGTEKVRLTAELVSRGIISECSCRTEIWKVLHNNTLYPYRNSTWNKQINDALFRMEAR